MKICSFLALSAALVPGSVSHSRAAVTIASVGVPVLNTFDTRPGVSEFATSSFLDSIGSAGAATSAAGLDDAINGNVAVNAFILATELPSSDSWPTTQNTAGRYNTGINTGAPNGGFLQFRPTSSAYVVTMARIWNDSGLDINSLTISYDYFVSTPNSVANEDIDGLRVYYSMIGVSGSWINIPSLSADSTVTSGTILAPEWLSTTLDLSATPWTPLANIYVLWVDDNGPPSADAQNPGNERGYAIDNLSFTGFAVPEPTSILLAGLTGILLNRKRR